MAFDDHVNFGIGWIATGPSPPASGTTAMLQPGNGALMPNPPFNATVWAPGSIAQASTAEIVRVTARNGDQVTMQRAQEGSAARAIASGDQFVAAITAKVIKDIEARIDGATGNMVGPAGPAGPV